MALVVGLAFDLILNMTIRATADKVFPCFVGFHSAVCHCYPSIVVQVQYCFDVAVTPFSLPSSRARKRFLGACKVIHHRPTVVCLCCGQPTNHQRIDE